MDIQIAHEQLNQALGRAAFYTKDGEVARYIPELAKQDPNQLGACVCLLDGTVITAGDVDTRGVKLLELLSQEWNLSIF
jgi:glutaminase